VAYEEQSSYNNTIYKKGFVKFKDSMPEDAVDFGLMPCSNEKTFARAEQSPLDEVQPVVVNGWQVLAMKRGLCRMVMLTMVPMVGAASAAWLTAWPA